MSSLPRTEPDPITAAVDVLRRHQAPHGAFPGDYSGPLFLVPMFVAAWHVADAMPEPEVRGRIVAYLRDVQHDDGSYGLGEQNPGTVFTTVLNYVALRLLGVAADDPTCVAARAWFRPRGGALGSASWGRFLLSVLNLHDYEGLDPVTPELWLLPRSLPIHPGRQWCHARMVYLPMSWLYGTRSAASVTPLIEALRTELYDQPYDTIRWRRLRHTVHTTDAYAPRTVASRVASTALTGFERVVSPGLRSRALSEVLRQIRYEDDITHHLCIGPVNKAYDTMVWAFAEPGGERVRKHLDRMPDYLHTDARGTRVNGYNNSELWDTAFGVQALMATGQWEAVADVAERAFDYVRSSQIVDDPPDRERHHRGHAKGGWPFSNLEHGWPITDCTAEGLKAALELAAHTETPIAEARLAEAVSCILRWQNPDGGWASYEKQRAGTWLEAFNPSDIFADIMVEVSYTECTSACVQALAAWRDRPGAGDDPEVDEAIARGRDFLLGQQGDDGGFYGSWGVCFTYGTWFGVTGLRAAGVPIDHPAIRRAAAYLESIQLPDGGWGEHVTSCAELRSVPSERSQAVMTSWALLALHVAGEGHGEAAQRGLRWLRGAQHADGTWTDTAISGVFNKTCSIRYDNYVRVFPLWALGVYGG